MAKKLYVLMIVTHDEALIPTVRVFESFETALSAALTELNFAAGDEEALRQLATTAGAELAVSGCADVEWSGADDEMADQSYYIRDVEGE